MLKSNLWGDSDCHRYDPVAFTIGSIEVRWYGIFIAQAVAVVALW